LWGISTAFSFFSAVIESDVILIRTAEDENVVGLQRVAEPVDDEELDSIDGSVAEGDDEIAPEADTDDEAADDADE
jgi:DNA gyrase subunit A